MNGSTWRVRGFPMQKGRVRGYVSGVYHSYLGRIVRCVVLDVIALHVVLTKRRAV
jgi:hypothetical protein